MPDPRPERAPGDLLYTQGYTIKGVQRLLREGGLEEAVAASAAPPAASAEPPETGVAALRSILEELEDISASLHDLLEG